MPIATRLTWVVLSAASEPLRLLEDGGEAADGERIWVRFPAWRRDLANYYQRCSGGPGRVIVPRVLTELLPVGPRH